MSSWDATSLDRRAVQASCRIVDRVAGFVIALNAPSRGAMVLGVIAIPVLTEITGQA